MRAALLIPLLVAAPAPALELTLSGYYQLNHPASLDYDPDYCGLWIANEGPEVILTTLDGHELRRFGSDLGRIKAITIEGDHILVADGRGSFQRLTKDGTPLGPPFRSSYAYTDTEGLAIDADGSIISIEDDPERLSWMHPDGTVFREIDTMTLSPPLSEPQGIARDPRTGHLLIVDDWDGTNSLYEFDADGNLLGTAPLIQYGTDPEGIALRTGHNQLFLAFDRGSRIAAFVYTPTLPVDAESPRPGGDCPIS